MVAKANASRAADASWSNSSALPFKLAE